VDRSGLAETGIALANTLPAAFSKSGASFIASVSLDCGNPLVDSIGVAKFGGRLNNYFLHGWIPKCILDWFVGVPLPQQTSRGQHSIDQLLTFWWVGHDITLSYEVNNLPPILLHGIADYPTMALFGVALTAQDDCFAIAMLGTLLETQECLREGRRARILAEVSERHFAALQTTQFRVKRVIVGNAVALQHG
jgi:hypothetical protein